MIAGPRPLPLRVDLVGLDLAQLPLLLPGLQRLARVHVVLVRVHLQQVLPLVEDHLLASYKHITSQVHHTWLCATNNDKSTLCEGPDANGRPRPGWQGS